jgi:hypothetical protein
MIFVFYEYAIIFEKNIKTKHKLYEEIFIVISRSIDGHGFDFKLLKEQ